MIVKEFKITDEKITELLRSNPNLGKNSHIGNLAVKIVELYFLSVDPKATFVINKKGIDIEVKYLNKIECFEIKGTADVNISWAKLKVSSKKSHDALINGMTLIRVTNIGNTTMNLYFMQHGIDFKLLPEPRWSVVNV